MKGSSERVRLLGFRKDQERAFKRRCEAHRIQLPMLQDVRLGSLSHPWCNACIEERYQHQKQELVLFSL
eukprot:3622553-Amphidinium_carterae.1